MKKTHQQNLTERYAELTWLILEDIFDVGGKNLPPIYFFLSEKSKGSLEGRSLYEIDLVHRQQYHEEGITLKFPPAAWVSKIEQVAEEAAHLFALTYQKSTVKTMRGRSMKFNEHLELWSMTLHEAFGKFASCLISGPQRSKMARPTGSIRKSLDLWEAAHREGYFLGTELAESYFNENLSLKDLRRWFGLNWYSAKKSEALKTLYSLLDESPATADFKKAL